MLETLYTTLFILFYLFLSAVLLYHRLGRRWLRFSFGMFCVYLAGRVIFFHQDTAARLRELVAGFSRIAAATRAGTSTELTLTVATWLALLVGILLVIGHGLQQEWEPRQVLGGVVIFVAAMAAILAVLELTIGHGALTAAWRPGLNP